MRIVSILVGTALAGAFVAAPAAAKRLSPEARLEKLLAGRTAGKPVNCVSLARLQSSEIIDRTAIVYRAPGNRLYVNYPRIGAESLDDDDILVTRTTGSQLCSIDTVRLLDRGSRFEHGFVGLGEFVPYDRPATAAR